MSRMACRLTIKIRNNRQETAKTGTEEAAHMRRYDQEPKPFLAAFYLQDFFELMYIERISFFVLRFTPFTLCRIKIL